MEYLKNEYKIDFEKKCKVDGIKNDTVIQNILLVKTLFCCDNIEKNISDFIDNKTLDEKKVKIKEQFQLISINAEEEIDEIVGYVKNSISKFVMSPIEYIWLKNVISITEEIPVSITIASARKEYFGFPLIYVNRQFEKTTEYNRKDILGKNCKFLQPPGFIHKEESQNELLKRSIQLGIPLSIIITNMKKSGRLFYNLITLNPVKDKDGNYLYCVGIQTELTGRPIHPKDMENIIDLMNILSKVKVNIIF